MLILLKLQDEFNCKADLVKESILWQVLYARNSYFISHVLFFLICLIKKLV